MKYYRSILAALALSLTLPIAASMAANAEPPKYVTVEKLTKVLNSENKDWILETLNTVKGMRYQGDILVFLKDLWDGERAKHPNLSWKTVNSPIVRIEIANVLLQARRNRRIEIDKTPIQKYLRERTFNSDRQVKMNAVLALGILGDVRDIPRMVELAGTEEMGVFRASVLALASICGEEAQNALDKLAVTVREQSSRYYIETSRQGYERFRSVLCQGRR